MNGRQLGRVHTDLAMANYVAQVIKLVLTKCTFLHLCKKLVGAKAGQDGTEVVQMLLEATIIYKDIVKVHNYVLIEHIEEHLVHQPLKG